MEGDAHLLHRRAGAQQRTLSVQQSAVGGDHDLEAELSGPIQDVLQLGVEQRLSHQVEVEILRMGPQTAGQPGKILRREEPRRPASPRTEAALQIAAVGDLQIGFFQLSHLLDLLICGMLYPTI